MSAFGWQELIIIGFIAFLALIPVVLLVVVIWLLVKKGKNNND